MTIMITGNIINIDDKSYTSNVFHVQIGVHCSIDAIVFADHEQEALDTVIDYYESKKADYQGFFFDKDGLGVSNDELDDYISGGNYGTRLTFTHDELRMTCCSSEEVQLYVDLNIFK